MSRRVLFGSNNYWTSPFQVGSHALARAFAERGWEVGYVSDPISPLHRLRGMTFDLQQRLDLSRNGGKRVADRIWSYVPFAPVTPQPVPLLRTEWIHRHWHRFSGLKDALERAGFAEVDLLLMDSPFLLGLMDIVNYRSSVARVADNFSGFTKVTRAARMLQNELLSRADLVVFTASTLEQGLKLQTSRPLMHLPNGVRFNLFQHASRDMPAFYRGLNRPIAVYVGAMEDWFDVDLVNRAARALPDMTFVMIGDPSKVRFEPLPNLHLVGRVRHADLPAYLWNADVGIIPFDTKNHAALVNSINPLKLYEYMACGLPVVSVSWEELRRIASPATLTETSEEFIAALHGIGASQEHERYIAYAGAQDWGSRADAIIAALEL
jgi:glycosyltransferase involved in cell wall biosynthesis